MRVKGHTGKKLGNLSSCTVKIAIACKIENSIQLELKMSKNQNENGLHFAKKQQYFISSIIIAYN